MDIRKFGLILALICAGAVNAQQHRVSKLAPLSVNPSLITVSGISAGGYMAVQLHVALSSVFKGAASVAGGSYWCAQGNPITAQMSCMRIPGLPSVDNYLGKAKSEESAGKIEKLSNLKNSRVFIYAGQKDSIVHHNHGDKLYDFYSKLTVAKNIKYKNDIPSGHGWITNRFGTPCGTESSPWISNCNYDLAGDILTHMYGPLAAPARTRVLSDIKKQLFTFDQSEFQTGNSSLYPTGYVYIPRSCQSTRSGCRLHVSLHGCQMNPGYIQDQYAVNSGLNEWAETNSIVVLYPQVANSGFNNPYGCWDWFGYTGSDYINKNGTQIVAIQKMIYRLLGKF